MEVLHQGAIHGPRAVELCLQGLGVAELLSQVPQLFCGIGVSPQILILGGWDRFGILTAGLVFNFVSVFISSLFL